MDKEIVDVTKVYMADTSCLSDVSVFEKYYHEMPQFRREKVDRMKMQEDKIRGLAAGVLLQKAYADFNKDGAAIFPDVLAGKNGKPYFVNSNIYFNLSHSGKKVMCALSTKEVGCDVEYKTKNSDKIAARFFAEEEIDYINSVEEGRDIRFTTVWTLKESLLKASGCGITYPMNEFSVIEANCIAKKITFAKDGLDYYLINYPGGDGYGFSCASLVGNFSDIQIIQL